MKRNLLTQFVLALVLCLAAGPALADGAEGIWCYDRGFCFDSDDGAWSLKLVGYGRMSFFSHDWEEWDDDLDPPEIVDMSNSGFKLVHAYIAALGHLGRKDVHYMVGMLLNSEPELLDCNFDYVPMPEVGLRMGLGVSYYSRSATMSASRLQFINRDVVTGKFSVGREVGVLFHGAAADGLLDYQVGILNGDGRATFTNGDDEMMYLARIGVIPLGKVGYAETAVTPFEEVSLLIAAKGLMNTLTDGTERTEFGGELVIGWSHLYVQSEIFLGTLEDDMGYETDRMGFYAQAGYCVMPSQLEVAGRFAAYSEEPQFGDEEQITEITLGSTWFWDGHYRKTSLNVTFREDDPGGSGEALEQTRIEGLFQIRF